MQVQVFVEGDANQEFRGIIPFTPYAPELLVPGCMDPAACNYAADATEDDGSCDYCGDACQGGGEYTITVEEYATDIVPGQTTYRFYQNMANEDDFLSSIYGNEDAPFSFETTTGFYNSQFGSTVASGVNPAFLHSSLIWLQTAGLRLVLRARMWVQRLRSARLRAAINPGLVPLLSVSRYQAKTLPWMMPQAEHGMF